jgi:threonine synthase
MYYKSTRNSDLKLTSAQAIVKGISEDGGLFIPSEIPKITAEELKDFEKYCSGSSKKSADSSKGGYADLATAIFKKFLTDFTDEEVEYCTKNAYNGKNWNVSSGFDVVELDKLYSDVLKKGEGINILELWHGKTCAFKDLALQALPYLLVTSAKKTGISNEIVILVATSGDTGKAALEGFKDVDGTKIIVFYPEDGVSPMQKKQMITQEGKNVCVCSVKGNFDDCQNGVKEIFGNAEFNEKLAGINKQLSSANSINWGRLLPQIVYYFYGYLRLKTMNPNDIPEGGKINICVPTGNFGNILAAYYAKQMGLPIDKLICASNKNNIITDFINTGVYDKNREFHTTISPSMDILISSNLERLLYLLYDGDDTAVKALYEDLKTTGKFKVSDEVLKKLQADFYGGYCDDDETKSTVKKVFETSNHYLSDTHTAVAIKVFEDYAEKTGDRKTVLIASTASPFKFGKAVLEALGGNTETDEYAQLEEITLITDWDIPEQLWQTKFKEPIFTDNIQKEEMKDYILKFLS